MHYLSKEEIKTVSIAIAAQFGDLTEKALTGDIDSIVIIGESYLKRKDYKIAMKFFTISATRNHARSQHQLGLMYNSGMGVPTDYKTAMSWYLKSFNSGYTLSGVCIATMYFHGHGVPQDDEIMMEWLLKAANAGCSSAQHEIAFFYHTGIHIKKDIQLALQWYKESADKGDEKSKMMIRELQEKGYFLVNNTEDVNPLEKILKTIEKQLTESENEKEELKNECKKMEKKIGKIKTMHTVFENNCHKPNFTTDFEEELSRMVLEYVGSNEFME